MNNKAKLIKKMIYKNDDPRERTYRQLPNGQVVADLQRQVYQETKKLCKNKNRNQVKQYLTKEK